MYFLSNETKKVLFRNIFVGFLNYEYLKKSKDIGEKWWNYITGLMDICFFNVRR